MGSALRAFQMLLRLNLSCLAHKLLASSSAALSWSGKGRLWLVEWPWQRAYPCVFHARLSVILGGRYASF